MTPAGTVELTVDGWVRPVAGPGTADGAHNDRRRLAPPPVRFDPVGLTTGEDGLERCSWGATTPDYRAYHDDEWGRPEGDDRRVYEKLCLEGFQAGLSWITILRKRDAFREAFAAFDPAAVATFGEADVSRLLADARIVRHRGKIEATIANARATIALQAEGVSLAGLVWSHRPATERVPGQFSELPSATPESRALSKALRSRGFSFVGPTTVYSTMQALGIVNDHLEGCHWRAVVGRQRSRFSIPAVNAG
ncbi:MAG TPA: DNA-3-methyladenine glycosylase I [Acidimicrobiales bacterium]|nr:DNA-3-methyladenine glycosylase I [Acidimicrobiales bacterium]